MNLKDIEWDEGKYSCYTGMIGSRKVATINYSTDRNDVNKWVLTVVGFDRRVRGNCSTIEEAKQKAPAFLMALVKPLFL